MLDALAGSGQFGTDAAGDQLAAVGFDQGGELLQDAVNRGKTLVFVHGSHPDRAGSLMSADDYKKMVGK